MSCHSVMFGGIPVPPQFVRQTHHSLSNLCSGLAVIAVLQMVSSFLILDFATFANAFTNTVACGKTSLIPVSKAELHCQQEIGGAGRIRTDE